MQEKKLEVKIDERGSLVEVFKWPEQGQIFYSTSKPRVTRGNHYHTRKKEYFCVIKGEALVRLRNRETNEIQEYHMSGDAPSVVEMTVNWTHNITNTGDGEMELLVWANEVFNPDDPDTYSEEV